MLRSKKTLFVSIAAAIAIVAIVGAVIVPRLLTPQAESGSDSVPTDSNFVEDPDQPLTNGPTPEKDKAITANPSAVPKSIEKPTITRAGQSGDNIRVSAILSNPSNGNCKLTATKSTGEVISKSAAILVGPSYYTCDGFLINRTEFSNGEWSITVTHELNDSTATSDAWSINVQ